MTRFDPEHHHRRSVRLKEYGYTQAGAYFITICTQHRECVFGDVADGAVALHRAGREADVCWRAVPDHFPGVTLDEWIVMPNHVHGIIVIGETGGPNVGARHVVPLPGTVERFGKPVVGSIPTIIRSFKSAVTTRVNILRDTPGASLWQRNYFERIIRDDMDLERIRQYIADNPVRWAEDTENPARIADAGTIGSTCASPVAAASATVGARHAVPLQPCKDAP